jgi:TetR/AcrR family transcriptional regulator, transcriptional repressor for nem operon
MKYGGSRAALLEAGGKLLRERGYGSTGLADILKSAGVPKGSFYHYFPSKDVFVAELIDAYVVEQRGRMEAHLGQRDRPPLERLRGYFESEAERYRREGCRGGCLVGNLGQELADQNAEMRAKLEATLREWTGRFADCLAEATRSGAVPEGSDIRGLSDFLMSGWQGALLRMKTLKSARPLHQFIEFAFVQLLAA